MERVAFGCFRSAFGYFCSSPSLDDAWRYVSIVLSVSRQIENARNQEFVSGFWAHTKKIVAVIVITDNFVICFYPFERLRTREIAKTCHEVEFSGVFYETAL